MSTLAAYYRLGDATNQTQVQDSSGNGNTGTLINGVGGLPAFGTAGAFLYDTNTALDLTNSLNTANGGFSTNNYATEPPTIQDPLIDAENWSVEMWFRWTGGTDTIPAPAVIPPGLTTLITQPTGFPASSYSATAAGSVVYSNAYATVGDLAILGIVVLSPTITVTGLSGIASGSWTLQVRNQDAVNSQCVDIWTAPVSSIAAPDVVTVTYSGTVTGVGAYYWPDSFTVGEGSNTIWSYPDIGVNQSATNVTTAVYPSLNADGSTNPQAYWGVAVSSGAIHGGSTSGFTYSDASDSEIAYNLDVYSGGNPWQPTTTTSSGKYVTVGMIVEAAISTAASTTCIPNGTLMHISGVNEFEPFTSYELQVGFAEIVSGPAATTVAVTNGLVECFGDADEFNVYTYPTNPLDGSWHYVAKCSGLNYPYLDGSPPSTSTGSTAVGGNVSGVLFGTAPNGIGLNPNNGSSLLNANAVSFVGSLQDVAMYTANLSPAQIANHWDIGMWFQMPEYGASVGGSSAGRFNKVLAVAGLSPENILVVPYPFLTEVYAESNVVTTTSALNYMQTGTESEPGLIYQGPDGLIYAFNREYQYVNQTSVTPQAIISDSDNSEFYYEGTSLAIVGDDLDIWNDIQVQSGIPTTATTSQVEVGQLQEFGPAQSPLMAYSASVYGSRTLQGLTSLQIAHDSDAKAISEFYGMIYYLPIERVTQMVLNAQGNGGANISQILARRVYDAFEIQYTGQTPGPTFSQVSLIESLTHTVDMDWPSWSTSYAMSGYEVILPCFYLDSSTMDGPDVLVL